MKAFEWSEEKNKALQEDRGVSFEEVLIEIASGNVLDILQSSTRANQQLFVVRLRNYVYYVPFVEDDEKIFLKTIIPSRKLAKKYSA